LPKQADNTQGLITWPNSTLSNDLAVIRFYECFYPVWKGGSKATFRFFSEIRL